MNFIETIVGSLIKAHYQYLSEQEAHHTEMERQIADIKVRTAVLQANTELAQKYFPKGAGSIFSFELKGGYQAGRDFIDKTEIFSNLANVGDSKSLLIHPSSTTHQQLDAKAQEAAGITPGTVRISVGIENVDDLIADLEQALASV